MNAHVNCISRISAAGMILALLLLVAATPAAKAQERKRVGLVLSGGGAKGLAHIGVLKVLEEIGIPVDAIAGASMGAIVGGLYAIGYAPRELDSIARAQDWIYLLGDKVYRDDVPFPEKETTEKYLLSMPVSRNAIQLPQGFVSGQNIHSLFMELTAGYHDSTDFRRLPTPFACVASNLADGKEVVLDRGVLARAMRASMAIPGVFSPASSGGMVLVDGGVSNNFPVELARAMGAEILIGVDVQAGPRDEAGLETIMGVVDQLVTFLGSRERDEKSRRLDLHLRPDLSPYSAASFSREAVAALIRRGEQAARSRQSDLLALKRRVWGDESPSAPARLDRRPARQDTFPVARVIFEGCDPRDERWLRAMAGLGRGGNVTRQAIHGAINRLYGTGAFERVDFTLSGAPVPDLTFRLEGRPASSLNVGFRFDSEEMAAVLLNTTLAHERLRGSRLALTGRLSMNPRVTLDYSLGNTFLHRFHLAYTFKYSDLDFHSRGARSMNVSLRYHRTELDVSNLFFKNINLSAGARYDYFHYQATLRAGDVGDTIKVTPGGVFSYYLEARLDTRDRQYYPARGASFQASYALCTDNLYAYNGAPPFSVLDFAYESVASLSRRVKLLPSLRGRVLIGNTFFPALVNCIGGAEPGRYLPQQIPFVGARLEPVDLSVIVARLQLRYRLGEKHYLSLVANGLLQDDNFFDLPGGDALLGGSIGYSYDSIIGPLSVEIDYSSWSRKPGAYVNIGYYF
ncbi:MAG: patatin-like phospholipase family protein [Odoribacteraceae bacterium]|nr:patatin-like phospholipase family protein [Odoribacteraceae bacterium]